MTAAPFNADLVKITRKRFSVTQGEVLVEYDGQRIEQYGDEIRLVGKEYQGRDDAFWMAVAKREAIARGLVTEPTPPAPVTIAKTDENAVRKLADCFVAVVREWVEPADFAEVKRRNVEHAGTNICATHDFIDANMAMDEAFRRTFGAGPLDDNDHMSDSDIELWSNAWDLAKIEQLTEKGA